MGEVKCKNEASNEDNAAANTSISYLDKSEDPNDELRRKLRQYKSSLRDKLASEFPVPDYSVIDKQCYSFLRDVEKSYTEGRQEQP